MKFFDDADPKKGNREVFAGVAASRLLWLLGFQTSPVFPVTITCLDCPADPEKGEGERAVRRYAASFAPYHTDLTIMSDDDRDQGWSFGELDAAIEKLPAGDLRARQRMHFDALSLLAVMIQHGDRKHEQQRLACLGRVDRARADLRKLSGHDGPWVLLEGAAGQACAGRSAAALVDVGATFGGAGQTTNRTTAKMNLDAWAESPVFVPAVRLKEVPSGGHPAACHGEILISGAAGEDGRGDPRIGEAGREFLLEQLHRLTPAQVRALFETAGVDRMRESHEWKDHDGVRHTGVDAWTAVFLDKVRQIEKQRCAA